MKIRDIGPVGGDRREMSADEFEELCALQCTPKEIIGWTGTTEKKLGSWCRRRYGKNLEDTVDMLRQDGLVEIRRSAFELIRKNAALVNKLLERYIGLPGPTAEDKARSLAESGLLAVRQFVQLADPPGEHTRALFTENAAGDEENGEEEEE